jgi:hypothetical protein
VQALPMNEKFVPIIIIISVVIALAIVAAVVSAYFERKRTEAFKSIADELSFEFFPTGRTGQIQELTGFHLFGIGHTKEIKNHLRGEAGGIELNIFDYRYVTGHGKQRQTHSQSVLVARAAGMNLPLFSMRPESFWNKIGNLFGLKDIDFESHPKFSRLYLLKGPHEAAIRDLFQPHVLEYFEDHTGLNIEGLDDLLIYSTFTRLKPQKIRDFMTEGFEILKLFQPAGGESSAPAKTD